MPLKTILAITKMPFQVIEFFLILWGGPLLADQSTDIADLDLQSLLDNIVLSASKHEEVLAATPTSLFIVTHEMIEDYGCPGDVGILPIAAGILSPITISLS